MNGNVNRGGGSLGRAGFLLSQLGAFSSGLFADLVEPLGLTPASAGVLRMIARQPGLSQRELASAIGTAPSRIVVLVDTLEQAGLVRRERSTTDRRTQLLRMTEQGTTAMTALQDAAQRQSAMLLDPLSEVDRDELIRLLDLLVGVHHLSRQTHIGYGHERDALPDHDRSRR